MRCDKVREWVRMRADEPLEAAAARTLNDHLSRCAGCASYRRDIEDAGRLVASVAPSEPSASFDWRLKAAIARAERGETAWSASTAPAAWRAWLQFGGAMAAAAAVVIAVGLGVLRQQQHGPGTAPVSTSSWMVPPNERGMVTPVRDAGRAEDGAAVVAPRVPYATYSYFLTDPAPRGTVEPDSAARAGDVSPPAR